MVIVHRVFGAHQIGRHQRRDETGDREREEYREGDRQTELDEVLARNAGHERDRHEDGDDGEAGGDDGEADFVRRFQCRAIGRLAHLDVAGNVLDFHDGVVHENTRGEREREEADEVEREAHDIHDPEGRDRGERQRHGGNQGCAPVAEEEQDHDDGEDSAFDQRVERRLVVAIGEIDGVIDHFDRDIRMVLAHLIEACRHGFGDRDLAGALGAEHREGDGGVAVEPREGLLLLIGVCDRAELGKLDETAVGKRNRGVGKLAHIACVAERADGLLVTANLAAAGAEVDIGAAQLAVHLGCGDAIGVELFGAQRNAHLAVGAAVTVDLADAGLALQRALDRVIHEPGQFFQRHVR
ncbi:hypothetical protein D3C71_1046120 [compost metagenome]